jgi:hypothetical protein
VIISSPEPRKPKLLGRVREAIRLKHYSLRTEKTYVDWIKRFILYHGKRHPQSMGAEEIRQIYTHVLNKPGMGVKSPLD